MYDHSSSKYGLLNTLVDDCSRSDLVHTWESYYGWYMPSNQLTAAVNLLSSESHQGVACWNFYASSKGYILKRCRSHALPMFASLLRWHLSACCMYIYVPVSGSKEPKAIIRGEVIRSMKMNCLKGTAGYWFMIPSSWSLSYRDDRNIK